MATAHRRLTTLLKLAATVCGAALLGALVYTGVTWDLRQASAEASDGYYPHEVARGSLREVAVATGRLEPRARVVVQSEIPGIVATVHHDDGERVVRGEPLVELDRERLEDRVAELRAALDRRRALASVALVESANTALEKARRDETRAQRLAEQNVLSNERLEQATHERRQAEIALGNAGSEKAANQAAVREAANALRIALRDLEKSVIRAPIDGVVVDRRVEVGSAVADLQNGGTVVAILADDVRLHLLAEVDENEVAAVRVQQPADVYIDAFPGETFAGTVREISFSGSERRGVSIFEVEIELEPDPRARVGMSADARIVVAQHENVLLVPTRGILQVETGPVVRKAGADAPEDYSVVSIEEDYSDGFQTIVTAGLREGDRILIRGTAD